MSLGGFNIAYKQGRKSSNTSNFRDELQERPIAMVPHATINYNFLFVRLPFPIFTSTPPSLVTPNELSTLRQTCQSVGFPPPVLSSTRLGMSMPVGKTEVKDGSLTIKNLSPVDSGLYECVATNSMDTKKAKMNVIVQHQPKGMQSFLASTIIY